MSRRLDGRALDLILDKMIRTVGDSKQEIYQISEASRDEFTSLTEQLKEVKIRVHETIHEGERIEVKLNYARTRLSEVSQQFEKYSEDEVREAYEYAHDLRTNLSLNRQQEKQLRERRDEIERRLLKLEETILRADHLVSQITVVLNYLTVDLREVNRALEDAKRKQDFGFQIIEAQEEERKKLSRDIHDGPAQMLANVILRSDLIERIHKEHGIDEAMKEIKSLKGMVRSALYEVRRIIYDLRPMALDDLGLVPTLKKYLHTVEDYHKTVISFVTLGEEQRLPSKLEVALFRLVQEAVQNANKHANASEIQVKIERKQDFITVVVKDNGNGFEIGGEKAGSFGLMGMTERVELLEGKMKIDSTVGMGTTIRIVVPLKEK